MWWTSKPVPQDKRAQCIGQFFVLAIRMHKLPLPRSAFGEIRRPPVIAKSILTVVRVRGAGVEIRSVTQYHRCQPPLIAIAWSNLARLTSAIDLQASECFVRLEEMRGSESHASRPRVEMIPRSFAMNLKFGTLGGGCQGPCHAFRNSNPDFTSCCHQARQEDCLS
jgi:hypothetical protein